MNGSEPVMARDRGSDRLALPADLERRLVAFRGRVWRTKLLEAACRAACGILVGYLLVFGLDRILDTPRSVRLAAFLLAVAACMAIPVAGYRWVWRQRTFEQLARLVGRRFPQFGDQLLGIVEIVRNPGEQRRSRALCEAAIAQVAARSAAHDLAAALPRPRHLRWLLGAAILLLAAGGAAGLVPAAAGNAWARFLAPLARIPRFTFTQVAELPGEFVVPHGEPATLPVALAAETARRPATARLVLSGQPPLEAPLAQGGYAFALPPQLDPVLATLAVGDARERLRILPMLRPDVERLLAEVELPGYLRRPGVTTQDVRGGTLVPVKGSRVAIVATASRPLAAATVDGLGVAPAGAVVRTAAFEATADRRLTIDWRDPHGLSAAKPLVVQVAPRDDEPPTVAARGLPPGRGMLLASDTLAFTIDVTDDFGIARVGLEWAGEREGGAAAADAGERILDAGGPEAEALEVAAAFCPESLGIRPQPLVLRAFAEDFLPGRGRVYSAAHVVYVVDRAEHALVMNERLARWRQQASEVRDREKALLAANEELRGLPAEELLEAENRRKLQRQAAAEQAQGRRMERLVADGGALVREAIKNPEFEAQTLERLAEDIQTLAAIGAERMPGVADLLAAAAKAPQAVAPPADGAAPPADRQPAPGDLADRKPADGGKPATPPAGDQPPRVGEDRSRQGGGGSQDQAGSDQPPVPQVADRESSQQPATAEAGDESRPGGGAGRLGLPTTQAGTRPPDPPAGAPPAAAEALAGAVDAQRRLLDEFARVADDLAAVMASLEGSTFVKRLKLAARNQGEIAGRIAGLQGDAFGGSRDAPAAVRTTVREAAQRHGREAEKLSNLMDDMQAYLDRRQLPAFRTVLEEMKDLDALGGLRQLSGDVVKQAGMSIAQSEFWSDTFDRLADELVTPPQGDGGGGGGGGENRESLPPEVVLEMMQILAAETNLREETRVAEQARRAVAAQEHAAEATKLADRQDALAERVGAMTRRLMDAPVGGPLFGRDVPLFGPLPIPDGRKVFRQEIELFDAVEDVMREAAGILDRPDTGQPAVGAETEVIELLLAAQAASSGGGGGGGGGGGAGGGSPGRGTTGTTSTSALALVGSGNTARGAGEGGEKRQATGSVGRVLPEEFRAGLDAYFNRFEKERP